MKVPNWYEALLLAAAAFRIYRLIAEDTILDRPRRYILRLGSDWQPGMSPAQEAEVIPENYRAKWATFITCYWCAGFWISVAWWGAWYLTEDWAVGLAVPFAISAAVALIAKNLDEQET